MGVRCASGLRVKESNGAPFTARHAWPKCLRRLVSAIAAVVAFPHDAIAVDLWRVVRVAGVADPQTLAKLGRGFSQTVEPAPTERVCETSTTRSW